MVTTLIFQLTLDRIPLRFKGILVGEVLVHALHAKSFTIFGNFKFHSLCQNYLELNGARELSVLFPLVSKLNAKW